MQKIKQDISGIEKDPKYMQSLEKGMEDFLQGDEERYRKYLQVMTKFHSYSLNNILLIAMQRPDATLCNSYKRWQGLGRQKGNHCLSCYPRS